MAVLSPRQRAGFRLSSPHPRARPVEASSGRVRWPADERVQDLGRPSRASDAAARAPLGPWSTRVAQALHAASGVQPSAQRVASELGLTVRTLDRYLAKEAMTFRAVARRVLVEKARVLLRRPGATVRQVATELGFSDAANFTRAFRRATGMTPSDFQRRVPPP